MTYTTPGGNIHKLYADILKQPHTLIAGATGSGKSVLLNGLIATALYKAPSECQFILIDPKRVELRSYKELPHTLIHATETPDIIRALNYALCLMESRYKRAEEQGLKQSTETPIYIIIDEFADLMTTAQKYTLTPLCRLAQLGRAANIHLILATQRPTRDIINGQIKVNIDSRVALRCPTAQDSRNIINIKGAEMLPRNGYGYYLTPDTMQPVLVEIPFVSEDEINRLIAHWRRRSA